MPDVISNTNGKLCVGSYHMWRLLSNPDNYSLPTAREGNVFTHVCDSVHNRPHGYSVTAHPFWLLGHTVFRRGRYASYWSAEEGFWAISLCKSRPFIFT